jgi:ribose-phosphate pyrophosphokinase
LKIFSGTANRPLAESIAKHLGLSLSPAEVIRFDNSEVRVRVECEVRDEVCVVIQSTSNPTDTNLMELFLFCDALMREEAKKVIVVMPYLGYARQNIQHRSGEAVSVNVVIRLLEALGVSRIVTCDLHDEGSKGIFSIPFTHTSTLAALAETVKNYIGHDVSPEHVAIVSPDQGGIERARTFGSAFFGNDSFDLTVVEKSRNQDVIHTSRAVQVFGETAGKTVIIVDDVTTSGGTLIHAAEACIAKGATRAVAAIAHHDLGSSAPAKIQDSPLEKLFSTNTIALDPTLAFDKLQEVDISATLAQTLRSQ